MNFIDSVFVTGEKDLWITATFERVGVSVLEPIS